MELFKNKFRIGTARLKLWDYSGFGYYFVTVCAKNHEPYFGKVEECKVKLSAIGETAKKYWKEIPAHFGNAGIDEFVIMPNHIHGIIKIKNKVETRHGVSLQLNNDFLRPAKGSLAAIVGQFKSSVKRWATKNDYKNFAWQRLYYDHIIRNETSLNKIREYIANNVIKWEIDEYHPDKIKILKNNF